MSDNLISILEKSKLFQGFSPEQMEQIVSHMHPKIMTLNSGDILYKRGKSADRCWLIQSGQLILKRLSLRTPFRQMFYHTGAVTGIQGLVEPGTQRVVTMIAEGQVKLIEITHEGISRLDKKVQIQLWKNISKLLLGKLSVCLSQESSP